MIEELLAAHFPRRAPLTGKEVLASKVYGKEDVGLFVERDEGRFFLEHHSWDKHLRTDEDLFGVPRRVVSSLIKSSTVDSISHTIRIAPTHSWRWAVWVGIAAFVDVMGWGYLRNHQAYEWTTELWILMAIATWVLLCRAWRNLYVTSDIVFNEIDNVPEAQKAEYQILKEKLQCAWGGGLRGGLLCKTHRYYKLRELVERLDQNDASEAQIKLGRIEERSLSTLASYNPDRTDAVRIVRSGWLFRPVVFAVPYLGVVLLWGTGVGLYLLGMHPENPINFLLTLAALGATAWAALSLALSLIVPLGLVHYLLIGHPIDIGFEFGLPKLVKKVQIRAGGSERWLTVFTTENEHVAIELYNRITRDLRRPAG